MSRILGLCGLGALAGAPTAAVAMAADGAAPPAAPQCPPAVAAQSAVRVLGASDPAAARRAEDHIIAAAMQRQPPAGETPEAKLAREERAKELNDLARASRVEAFDPGLFEKTRAQAQKALTAAEEQREAARQAWEQAPAGDGRADAEKDYCATLAAYDQAKQFRESADKAVQSSAAATALSELQQRRMEQALAEADAAKREALAQSIDAARGEIARAKAEAFDHWFAARRVGAPSLEPQADRALSGSASAPGSGRVLSNGARLSWGVTGSLLRFRTERNPNLPGGDRNFRPRFEFVPAEAGFQFLSEPDGLPWRLQLKDGGSVQIVSWGGMLLAGLGEDSDVERGNLSLAATLAFFDNTIGLGAGFDLYRGIPVLGADGTSGGDTAFTGALAWALSPEGEVTAENAFLVVTINLSTLIDAVSGKHEGQ